MVCMRQSIVVLLSMISLAAGCDGGTPPIETFAKNWNDAINSERYDQLFELLDAISRREIDYELKQLRGLAETDQQYLLDHLGGERIDSLRDLTASKYFARKWRLVLRGRNPKMKITAHGGGLGEMTLELDKSRRLRVELKIEAEKWVWRLPRQRLIDPLIMRDGSAAPRREARGRD